MEASSLAQNGAPDAGSNARALREDCRKVPSGCPHSQNDHLTRHRNGAGASDDESRN